MLKTWMLAALIPLGAAVSAQEQAGSVRGSVYDKDFGVPLSGALVTAVEAGQRVATSPDGNYVFSALPPGRYTLVFTKEGYVRAVRPEVLVNSGQLTDVSVELSGEFNELEELVVQDLLQAAAGTEASLLKIRFDSPAQIDSISEELMKRAGASDAASGLRLVSGASVQDGKYAVIRGLPDRYVSSQLNGIRLPSADEDKRAVELDQFPSAVIESLQVSKTFTPDQQGDASGGAVDVRLKGIPDANVLQLKGQYGYNSQAGGESNFLTFDPGSGHVQPVGQNWDGDVGVSFGDAPVDSKWAMSAGGKLDLGDDIRIGGFANVFYERDSSFFDDGIDDAKLVTTPGGGLEPETAQISDGLFTSLFDVTQASEAEKWAGLATIGLETEHSQLGLAYLFTRIEENTATLAEDTRGKEFYFPGYDPDDPSDPGNDPNLGSFEGSFKAPYNRAETLEHTERTTSTLQLRGKHQLPGEGYALADDFVVRPPELSWSVSRSTARLDQPDKKFFGTYWLPGFSIGSFDFPAKHYPLTPADNSNVGNLQRVWKEIDEESHQFRFDMKVPFDTHDELEGYLKTGVFHDLVERTFDQDTFSNVDSISGSSFEGEFDDLWSKQFPSEPDHQISASLYDVDYDGEQRISAWYLMADYPLTSTLNVIGGARVERTSISVINKPEELALWYPNGQLQDLEPGDADVDFDQQDVLPALGLVFKATDTVTLRASYSETVAHQTFKELTPVLQQEFLGGPIFIGNPELQMSALKNYDLRCDYTPYEDSLLSASVFHKDVTDPIEYVQAIATNFSYTTAVNYPDGKLDGIELEARQGLQRFSDALEGLTIGANATFLDSQVTLPQNEIDDLTATGSVNPSSTRDMTNAPDHLFNVFVTYTVPPTGTEIGLFYTIQGETLLAGEGTKNLYYIPSVYASEYDTLNLSISQKFGKYIELQLQAKNLTNPDIETVYRSDILDDDVTKTSYTKGIDWSISLSVNF